LRIQLKSFTKVVKRASVSVNPTVLKAKPLCNRMRNAEPMPCRTDDENN